MKLNPLDPSDQSAMEPYVMAPVYKSATSYNNPGMPKPPGGWAVKGSTGPMPGGVC